MDVEGREGAGRVVGVGGVGLDVRVLRTVSKRQSKLNVVPIGCDGGGRKPGVVGPTWVPPTPHVVPLPITVSSPGSETVNVYVWSVTPDSLTVVSPLVNVTVGATLLIAIVCGSLPVAEPSLALTFTMDEPGPSRNLQSKLLAAGVSKYAAPPPQDLVTVGVPVSSVTM